MKRCSVCQEDQPSAAFKAKGAQCRACLSIKRRARYAADPARERARNLAWSRANRARHSALNLKWREKNRERSRQVMRDWMRVARRTRPEYSLRFRIAAQIAKALHGARKSGPTFKRLGYTLPMLRAHLERQFLPGMGWHNSAKWHIDHIVPLASFKMPDELRQAWALPNLRPLWAADNQAKHAKRVHLL